MRAIDITEIQAVEPPADLGPPPALEWIALASLVIDPSYQRDLNRRSVTHIRTIAARFDWRMFSVVVVAPVEDGRFAIIDGQHRATAAQLAGVEKVPCQIVHADRQGQAAAFTAINTQSTGVPTLYKHRAALAAGEADALALQRAALAAGVTILTRPKPTREMAPGETQSIAALSRCLRQFGHDTVVTAMQCVTESANNVPGLVNGPVISGICDVLHSNRAWRDAGEALLAAFDKIPLERVVRKSVGMRGESLRENVRREVLTQLARQLPTMTVAA